MPLAAGKIIYHVEELFVKCFFQLSRISKSGDQIIYLKRLL